MTKGKNILFPFLSVLLPVFSSYFYQPFITGSISNIIPIILLPYFFKNCWFRPFYFILLPLLLATRTPESFFGFSYEFIIILLFFLIPIKDSIFKYKNSFKIPKIFFVFLCIFVYQILISLFTSSSGETSFSIKIFGNYSLSFIYLMTFGYYCLNNIKYLDSIIYALGFAGPLTGLIAIGYRLKGIQMINSSLGLDFDTRYLQYAENDIFHYANILRYTYTNVSLVVLISIFSWLLIIRKRNIKNIYNKFSLRINENFFYKFMFVFSIIILFLFTSKSTIFSLILVFILYCTYYILNNFITSPLKIKLKSLKLLLYSFTVSLFSYLGINFLLQISAVLGDLDGASRLIVFKNLFAFWTNDLYGYLSLFFGQGLFLNFNSSSAYLNIVDGQKALDSFWLGFTFKAGLMTILIILYFILNEIIPSLKIIDKQLKIITIFSLIAISLSIVSIVIGDSKVLWILLAYLGYIAKSYQINHEINE